MTVIEQVSAQFPVVLITGPRQVGKTTLLEMCSEGRNYVTLDDLDARALAKSDPALFLQRHKPPLIIDEIQYAPELFSYLKIHVDKDKQPGLFWLTGSQKFHLMKHITESLAGRVAILDMLGLSQEELDGSTNNSIPFIPTASWIEQARTRAKPKQLMDVYQRIWQGSFPALWQGNKGLVEPISGELGREIFYKSYLQTYIQRDVRDLTQVGDELSFQLFLRAVAARSGQVLNYADMARDVGIDQKTAKSWLSILETSGLVYLLQPYYSNITKRLTKSPKLYMLDTGLCAFLTNWTSAEALEAGAMSGAILETYLISELLKTYWHNGRQAPFYYYRDTNQKEIDLLIEQDNKLYPVEFKKTATPSLSAAKHFPVLGRLDKEIGEGAIICFRETDIPLSEQVSIIPIAYL